MTAVSTNNALRPRTWADYVGQEVLKDRLMLHIDAAITDERPLSHVLLTGPPGFGKTSLASLIADELGDPMVSLKMPVKGAAFTNTIKKFGGGVLFLDEVHNASKAQQEDLLPLLEDGYLALSDGRRLPVPWLTVIAATTEPERLIAPLTERFTYRPATGLLVDDYTPAELGQIVQNIAKRVGVKFSTKDAEILGRATGGAPRNARDFVLTARDMSRRLDRAPKASEVLALLRIDEDGLTEQHRRYLTALQEFAGVAGLSRLADRLRLDECLVREVERLLLDLKLITYAKAGRELTQAGWARVGGGHDPVTASPRRLRSAS